MCHDAAATGNFSMDGTDGEVARLRRLACEELSSWLSATPGLQGLQAEVAAFVADETAAQGRSQRRFFIDGPLAKGFYAKLAAGPAPSLEAEARKLLRYVKLSIYTHLNDEDALYEDRPLFGSPPDALPNETGARMPNAHNKSR